MVVVVGVAVTDRPFAAAMGEGERDREREKERVGFILSVQAATHTAICCIAHKPHLCR